MLNKRFFANAICSISIIAALVVLPHPASAIVVYGSEQRNVIAPTGEYASIPWDRVGLIGGTNRFGDPSLSNIAWPISPNWALRAFHVTGGATGYDIFHDGTEHRVEQSVRVLGTDLDLVRVSTPFTNYSLMYSGTDEAAIDPNTGRQKELFVAGGGSNSKRNGGFITAESGRQNGFSLGGVPDSELGQITWGRNQVSDIVQDDRSEYLYSTFDSPTLEDGSANPNYIGPDEAAAFSGDSGGGIFMRQGGDWRLTGLMYAIDGYYYNDDPSVTQANVLGAIYDSRDLWTDFYIDPNNPSAGTVRRQITGSAPVPGGFYATRLSTYRSQIDAITGQTAGLGVVVVPEAGTGTFALLGIGCLGAGIVVARRRNASVA